MQRLIYSKIGGFPKSQLCVFWLQQKVRFDSTVPIYRKPLFIFFIYFLYLFSFTFKGIASIREEHPDVDFHVAAIDEVLNEV